MFKLSHAALAFLSGIIWMAVGFFLLPLGLSLILGGSQDLGGSLLLGAVASLVGGTQEAAIILIALGLYVGFLKGKYVLGKSAQRGIERIRSFPNPTSIGNIYSPRYYLLLGSMIALGLSIKYFGLPNDIRGIVDVTIGAALINGALIYFRSAASMRLLNN